MPWYWTLAATPWYLDTPPGPSETASAGARPSLRLGGSARVEVWGEDRVTTLNLFRARLNPALVGAYKAGLGVNGVAGHVLGEVMAMGAGFHPPSVHPVYYNCYRPPVALESLGVDFGLTSAAHLRIMAGSKR